MLGPIRRLFSKPPPTRDFSEIEDWADRRGYAFKRVRGEDGFVIDGVFDGKPWRMEWGAPQRVYIEGFELRIRMELGLNSDAQMLVLSRPLLDSLERQTFEEFTDDVQTQIGMKTPEEMRWLVMFTRIDLGAMKVVRARYGGVASSPVMGMAWVQGPLGNQLERAALGWMSDAPPFVLMTLRGRAYLRVRLVSPDARSVSSALSLFETAVVQAVRVTGGEVDGDEVATSATGGSTEWQSLPHLGPGSDEPSER